jgi:peptidoglycan biosynthesis protein MviN/MurJ (putative lipid II flippase)
MIFPLSTSLAAALNFWLLVGFLPKKIGKFEMRPLGRYFASLTAASVIGGAAAWFGNQIFVKWLGAGFLPALAGVIACGLLGLAVFYGASRLLGMTETRDYLRRFLRR